MGLSALSLSLPRVGEPVKSTQAACLMLNRGAAAKSTARRPLPKRPQASTALQRPQLTWSGLHACTLPRSPPGAQVMQQQVPLPAPRKPASQTVQPTPAQPAHAPCLESLFPLFICPHWL